MPTEIVAKQFARIAGIVQNIDDKPVSKNHVKLILGTAELFLNGFKHAPDIFVAQSVLFKTKHSYVENLTFNTLMFCALLCNRNKINDLCCQQMLSSILTLYAERQSAINIWALQQQKPQKPLINTGLRQLLKTANMEVWRHGYDLVGYVFADISTLKRWPKTLNRVQRIILFSHLLSVSLTYRKNNKLTPFHVALKALIQASPQQWTEDLEGLLAYPGELLPGSVVRSSNNQPKIVLATSENKLLVSPLDKETQQAAPLQRIYPANVVKTHGAQSIGGFKQIHTWWGDDYQQEHSDFDDPKVDTFPLDKPPKVLLEVQKHLNTGQVDIDKLAEQISAEPAFSEYLKQTATLTNRNKLPVQQVKHGLMMHGYLRANNLLIEQALLLRLNQSYFPLQQDFTQFTRLAAQIAFNLAALNKQITPEQASNLVCFACSGLFTQQALKTRTNWRINQENQFSITSLFQFNQSTNLKKHAITLCQTWQQPKLFVDAIEHHHELPLENSQKALAKIISVILGLSLCGARLVFFGENSVCHRTNEYQQQGCELLNINERDYLETTRQSVELCHTYRHIG